MDALGQCFAAKHVYEGLMPCTRCGAELVVGTLGWALTGDPDPMQPAVCTSCGASWNAFDARRLVETARQLGPTARRWLEDYIAITEQLRGRIGDRLTVTTAFGTFHGLDHFKPTPRFVADVARGRSSGVHGCAYDLDVTAMIEVIALELRTRRTAALGRAGTLRMTAATIAFDVRRPC